MKRNLFFLFIFFSLIVYSQKYNLEIKVDSFIFRKQRIFIDHFVDNRHSWLHPGAAELNSIQDGFLFYSNPFDFPYYDGKPINFDSSQDFEIDTKIKFISGDVQAVNGIFWGDLIFGVKFLLGFAQFGDYVVIKNRGIDEIKLGLTRLNINRSGFNRLTVRKIGGYYYFYINDQLIYKMNYRPISARYIGFFIAQKSYIQIAYLRVWKLVKKTKI